MRILLTTILTLCFCMNFLSAQQRGVCGNHPDEHSFKALEDNKRFLAEHGLRGGERYIPLKFHRVGDNDGTQRIAVSSILDQMCRLSNDYAQFGMVPYINDLFNEINNNSIFFNPNNSSGTIVNNKISGNVNIFVTENANTGPLAQGTVLGYNDRNGDFIVVRKLEFVDSTGTLSHELGHLLSLEHTFFGWEGIPYTIATHGNPLTIQTIGGRPIEAMNGDNCEVAADRICDTPTDLNFPFANEEDNLTNGCRLVKDVFDFNSDLIDPMEENHMSYFGSCDIHVFTEGQIDLMRADFDSPARADLRSDYIPNLEPVTEVPTVISPAEGATTSFFNSVQFEWEAVENADYYSIELSGGSGTISVITQNTSYLVTDLDPDSFYFWTIQAFNETSTCVRSEPVILQTNDESTSIQTLEDISEIFFSPNPLEIGQRGQLKFNSTKSFDANIAIHGLDGKEIRNLGTTNIVEGETIIAIETEDLFSGIYIIQISSLEGIYSQKLIVK